MLMIFLEHRKDIQTKYEKLLEIEKKMSAAREKMTKHSSKFRFGQIVSILMLF